MRSIRGFLVGVVMICAAALVACSGLSETTPISARPIAPAPPPALGAELPASRIPWEQVGPGWILAALSPTPGPNPDRTHPAGQPPEAPVTLYLLDPAGRRYAITTFPLSPTRPGDSGHTPNLVDWSGDGRHALFEDEFAAGGRATMTEVDLATGTKQTLTAHPCCSAGVAYSRPTGQAILVADFDTSSGNYKSYRSTLERVDLSGTKLLTYPTDQLGAAGKYNGAYLQTPDGSQLILGTDHGMAVMGNDGVVARQLLMPAPRSSCIPVRWWTSSVILAACNPPNISSASVDLATQLWRVPLAGGAPTALTPVDEQSLGYGNAWQVPSGTFLQDVPGCGGDGLLFRLTADMQTKQVTVPRVDGKSAVFGIGVTADKLVVEASTGCGSRSKSLLIYDPAANTSTVLLDGGVKRVMLYPTA
jgi:hypothetical protein